MGQAVVVKFALVSALAVAALGSTQIHLETSALDMREANKSAPTRTSVDLLTKAALTDADLVETHARPLFSQTRRPFVAKPPPAIEQQPVVAEVVVEKLSELPRRLALVGISSGQSASVLIRNEESAETRWLRVGEAFDGWTLAEATADGAVFTCAGQQAGNCDYRLTLYPDTRSQ